MLGTIITVVVIVIGIALSIALHELGHFLPAKKFGVPATEYFIGFGKTLWSTKRGETEYGVKLVPMGGYTQIQGMFPAKPKDHTDKFFKSIIEGAREASQEGMKPFDESRAFYNLTFGKKILIMAGGTLTNLVLGALCFMVAFTFIGAQSPTTTLKTVVQCQSQFSDNTASNDCSYNDEAPAYKSGMRAGDTVKEVNGQSVQEWAALQQLIAESNDKELEITAEREGVDKHFTIEAVEIDGAYKVGISPSLEPERLSLGGSLGITWQTVTGTAKAILGIPAGMVDAVRSLVTNQERQERNLVSVVGVGQIAVASEKATDDFAQKVANIFSILGSLNIALFVLNLIPLLPLDGGHSANAIYEALKRLVFRLRKRPRPGAADLARSQPVAYIIYGFLILMFITMVLADIFHPLV
ncbi:MAG: M50 family metallopeptidase [Candidatus Ancillula sp.]|jgi:membrane-associated protease RseP (regulator of RpoE activity)|nr:M50 family metallopeptidase [Candidatus Ancillula sp.]